MPLVTSSGLPEAHTGDSATYDSRASQEMMRVLPKPSMDKKRKLRCSDCQYLSLEFGRDLIVVLPGPLGFFPESPCLFYPGLYLSIST